MDDVSYLISIFDCPNIFNTEHTDQYSQTLKHEKIRKQQQLQRKTRQNFFRVHLYTKKNY